MKKYVKYIIMLTFIFVCSCNNGYNKSDKTYKFKTSIFSNNNDIPIIETFLKNKKCNLIIDTGSEINIINERFYYSNIDLFDNVNIIYSNIQTVNGNFENNETFIVRSFINDTIPVIFNVINIDNTFDNIFFKQKIMPNGILGVDFLYDNKVTIDFKNKILTNI